MRILFYGNHLSDELKYLRDGLPVEANDELIVCFDNNIRPMLEGVESSVQG
jgi:hypothetical protein